MNREVEKILKYDEEFKTIMTKIYPNSSEEGRENIFHLRVDFWKMIVDNL